MESYSGESEHFRTLQEITLVRGSARRSAHVTSVAVHNGTPVLQIEGINTPEDAKRYSGWEIVVPRDLAAPRGDTEYFVEDLIGARLLYQGDHVGTIHSIVDGGQGELIEVQVDEADGPRRIVLIPFMDRFIGSVDVGAGTVELRERWILDTESPS